MKKITGFVLACILFVLSCVNYAEASKNVCEHLVEDRIYHSQIFSYYSGNNGQGQHSEVWIVDFTCSNCSERFSGIEETRVNSCTYIGNTYDDLGHDGEMHRYRLHCDCGFTHTIPVPCVPVNGVHTKPF